MSGSLKLNLRKGGQRFFPESYFFRSIFAPQFVNI